jgi:hypothetical protein
MKNNAVGSGHGRLWSRIAGIAAIAVATVVTAPAQAHHSFALFDQTKKLELQGTVKDWQFTNPHSWLQLMVVENGQPVEYSIEGASVNTLARRGWGPKTFKPGDKVTVVVHPIKTGQKGGAFLSAKLPDGRTITAAIQPT